jgi:deoxyhypusine synthase
LESGVDSLPSSKCYHPNGLCCSVIASADGRSIMNKLIIGSRMMNMLITCSANINTGNALDIYVSPQVDLNTSQFTVEKTRIFLRREEIDRFKNMFQESFSHMTRPIEMKIPSLGKPWMPLLWI